MKVKEYLVKRILDLESDLKRVQNEKAGTTYALQKLQEDVIKLNEKIEQYDIDREHIKEIITCNISDGEIKLKYPQCDYTTLLSILDIKPEDYSKTPFVPECWNCKHEELDGNLEPCLHCYECDKFEPKEVTADAETEN